MASWRERLGLSGLLDLARRARRTIGAEPEASEPAEPKPTGLRAMLERAREAREAVVEPSTEPAEPKPTGLRAMLERAREAREAVVEPSTEPAEPKPTGLRAMLERAREASGAPPIEDKPKPAPQPEPDIKSRSDEELLEEYEKELRRLKKLREQLDRRGRGDQARQRQRRVQEQKPGRIVVDVSDEGGAFIEGATVEGQGPSGQVVVGQTDVDGRATFSNIEPGPWRIRVRASGYETGVVDIEVPSGRAVRVGVMLQAEAKAPPKPERAGTLIVHVSDPSGRPIEAVSLTLVGPSEQVLEGFTDEVGQAVFPGIESGNWRIIADAEDLQAQEANARIDPGKTTRVRLMMDFPPEDMIPEPKKEAPSPWLRGSSIHVPFVDPEGAFLALIDVWQTSRIGMRSDEGGPTKYNPNAYAKGSPVDPGLRIPGYALRSAEAFERWAQQNGFSGGLSITIDGMVAAPGRSVISDSPKLWTPEDR